MGKGKLLLRVLFILFSVLVIMPSTAAEAQFGKGNPITGQGYKKGKKVKQKKQKKEKKVFDRGKAGRAQRAQEQKAKAREARNAREEKKMKDHHMEIQSPSTRTRISENQKMTSDKYKEKKKKIRKDSHRPKKHRKP